MKIILKFFLLFFAVSTPINILSQVGINTDIIDPSSALEIFSEDKGLLMPRLTTVQRDAIINPAAGLMIYNSTLNDGQINTGTPTEPNWNGIKNKENFSFIESVTKGEMSVPKSLKMS